MRFERRHFSIRVGREARENRAARVHYKARDAAFVGDAVDEGREVVVELRVVVDLRAAGAAWIVRGVAAAPWLSRKSSAGRGGAAGGIVRGVAAAPWLSRGSPAESRRRRGYRVDGPRVAAAPRVPRGPFCAGVVVTKAVASSARPVDEVAHRLAYAHAAFY